MTTEKAIDILIKRGSNNDKEDEAVEMLAYKALAFDALKEDLEIFEDSVYGTECCCGEYVRIPLHLNESQTRTMRLALKEDPFND